MNKPIKNILFFGTINIALITIYFIKFYFDNTSFLNEYLLYQDPGFSLAVLREIINGKMLIKDVHIQYGPAGYLLLYPLVSLWGYNLFNYCLFSFLLSLLAFNILLYLVNSKLNIYYATAFVFFTYAIIIKYHPSPVFFISDQIFLFMTILCLSSAMTSSTYTPKHIVLAGVFSAMLHTSKFGLSASTFVVIVLYILFSGHFDKYRYKYIMQYALGFAAIILVYYLALCFTCGYNIAADMVFPYYLKDHYKIQHLKSGMFALPYTYSINYFLGGGYVQFFVIIFTALFFIMQKILNPTARVPIWICFPMIYIISALLIFRTESHYLGYFWICMAGIPLIIELNTSKIVRFTIIALFCVPYIIHVLSFVKNNMLTSKTLKINSIKYPNGETLYFSDEKLYLRQKALYDSLNSTGIKFNNATTAMVFGSAPGYVYFYDLVFNHRIIYPAHLFIRPYDMKAFDKSLKESKILFIMNDNLTSRIDSVSTKADYDFRSWYPVRDYYIDLNKYYNKKIIVQNLGVILLKK
ncbi:MAG: hypothetical protein NW207_09795 [Cytophagales bacterium]|nr:hypothetical protein [Cytophagales bacterium]